MGGERYEIRNGAPPLQFDGALAPMCWLLDGPTSDLNLLVRRDAGKGRMLDVEPGKDWVTQQCMAWPGDHRCRAPGRSTTTWPPARAARRCCGARRPRISAGACVRSTAAHTRGWWIEFRPRHEAAPMKTLWRHARLATMAGDRAVGMGRARRAAHRRRSAALGRPGRRLARRARGRRRTRPRRRAGDAGPDRLPHAPRLRRPPRARVRAAAAGRHLRRDRARRRRHPLHGGGHACGRRRHAVRRRSRRARWR